MSDSESTSASEADAQRISIHVHDDTIIAGPNQNWSLADEFEGATDGNGNPVSIDDITVSGRVDTTTPGDYEITYSYTDANGNTVSQTITVHVVESHAGIDDDGNDVIIINPGDHWDPSEGFHGGTDANGNPIDIDDVVITGNVDTTTPGDYEVTYTYTDNAGNEFSYTVIVHVNGAQAANSNGTGSRLDNTTFKHQHNAGNNVDVAGETQVKHENSNHKLPQTNDLNDMTLSEIGVLLLVIIAVIKKRKSESD